jgi:hypothetical protein
MKYAKYRDQGQSGSTAGVTLSLSSSKDNLQPIKEATDNKKNLIRHRRANTEMNNAKGNTI